MASIPAFGRQKQASLYEFKATMAYIASHRLAKATL